MLILRQLGQLLLQVVADLLTLDDGLLANGTDFVLAAKLGPSLAVVYRLVHIPHLAVRHVVVHHLMVVVIPSLELALL